MNEEKTSIQQRKKRLMEKYPHITEEYAESCIIGAELLSKPENRKDVPEISPELEAQLLALVGK